MSHMQQSIKFVPFSHIYIFQMSYSWEKRANGSKNKWICYIECSNHRKNCKYISMALLHIYRLISFQRHYENLMQGYLPSSDRSSIVVDESKQNDIKSAIRYDNSTIDITSTLFGGTALVNESVHNSISSVCLILVYDE